MLLSLTLLLTNMRVNNAHKRKKRVKVQHLFHMHKYFLLFAQKKQQKIHFVAFLNIFIVFFAPLFLPVFRPALLPITY